MAITSIKELRTERSGTDNNKNQRTYTRVWQVISNAVTDGPKTVEAAWVSSTGITAGSSYSANGETDNGAYALNIQTKCVSEDGLQWHVVCQYGPWDQEGETNPLLHPYDLSWTYERDKQTFDYDINGDYICNSAGDPFLEPLETDLPIAILTIERNEASFNYALAWTYSCAVNGTTFWGASPGYVKVRDISAKRVYDPTWGFYYTASYSFAFNPRGWKKILLDQGLRELVSGAKKNIMVQNTAITEPVPLNGSGEKLAQDATPQYRTYEIYPVLPFTVFAF